MRDSTNVYSCLSANFGDWLGPWMLEKCMGEPAVYIESPKTDCHHYVISGSILNHIGPRSEVWGAGLAAWTNEIDTNAKIHAVRGPLSALCARSSGCDVPHIYGDPGLCLPAILGSTIPKPEIPLGVVPHYNDAFKVREFHKQWGCPQEIKVIDILKPVEHVVSEITSCQTIISSSLHGLVVAQAYGIPWRWADFGGHIGGNGMKYWDFMLSVGIGTMDQKPKPLDLTADELGRRDLETAETMLGKYNMKMLWETCPFRPKGVQ